MGHTRRIAATKAAVLAVIVASVVGLAVAPAGAATAEHATGVVGPPADTAVRWPCPAYDVVRPPVYCSCIPPYFCSCIPFVPPYIWPPVVEPATQTPTGVACALSVPYDSAH